MAGERRFEADAEAIGAIRGYEGAGLLLIDTFADSWGRRRSDAVESS